MNALLLFIFLVSHSIYFTYNVWVAKHSATQQVAGMTFTNYWTFSLVALLIATPVLTVANYLFAVGFTIGYKQSGAVWSVIAFFLLAQLIAMISVPYLFFQELPNVKSLFGITLCMVGAFITMTARQG